MKKSLKPVVWKEGRHFVARALNVEVSNFGATSREALDLSFENAPASAAARIERPEVLTL